MAPRNPGFVDHHATGAYPIAPCRCIRVHCRRGFIAPCLPTDASAPPSIEMGIVHWLDALTWPASLVLKVIRATVRTVGGVIRQLA